MKKINLQQIESRRLQVVREIEMDKDCSHFDYYYL